MASYELAVIGAGYVGLVTAAGLTELGHHVDVAETDAERLQSLQRGMMPFYEPGLADLVASARRRGALAFSDSGAAAASGAAAVFVAVPTPPGPDGAADLTIVEKVVREVAPVLDPGAVIILKSTVPPGSARHMQAIADDLAEGVLVGSNPEFLRQGRALQHFLEPDRIVLGADDDAALSLMRAIYATADCPVLSTDPSTAELIKYGSNAFLATRISFINGLARVADLVGADIVAASRGMGLDPTIGRGFLNPGPGFGGSCLPKDTRALWSVAGSLGYDFDLLQTVLAINDGQIDHVVSLVEDALGGLAASQVALWGLAFKAGTDDTRESPACKLAAAFLDRGAAVRAYDPMAADAPAGVDVAPDAVEATAGAHALVVATEWEEFAQVDLAAVRAAMTGRLVVDARNRLDPANVRALGFDYVGIGRS